MLGSIPLGGLECWPLFPWEGWVAWGGVASGASQGSLGGTLPRGAQFPSRGKLSTTASPRLVAGAMKWGPGGLGGYASGSFPSLICAVEDPAAGWAL